MIGCTINARSTRLLAGRGEGSAEATASPKLRGSLPGAALVLLQTWRWGNEGFVGVVTVEAMLANARRERIDGV